MTLSIFSVVTLSYDPYATPETVCTLDIIGAATTSTSPISTSTPSSECTTTTSSCLKVSLRPHTDIMSRPSDLSGLYVEHSVVVLYYIVYGSYVRYSLYNNICCICVVMCRMQFECVTIGSCT